MSNNNKDTRNVPPPPYSANNSGPSGSQPTMAAPNYGNNSPSVVYVPVYQGACTMGGDHVFTTEFTLGGILCALFFFPIGVLCCLCLTEKRCVRCGARFD